MKVMLTRGWGRLDNVVSEIELDNPTKESIQDAIAEMYAAYIGQHFDSILFAWEMYNRCAIIGFGSGELYGAVPDCPEEMFPKPQQLVVIEKEKFDAMLSKVKDIAEQMRYHAKINRRCDDRNKAYTYLSIEAGVHDEYANQINEAIKEFAKGELNA